MFTACLGASSASPTAKAITVNELSRDIYTCGEMEVDSTS